MRSKQVQEFGFREELAGAAKGLKELKKRGIRILGGGDRAKVKQSARELVERIKELLVLNWQQKFDARAKLKVVIEEALDIGMPRLDGYEVARQLRQSIETEAIHLVAVSGWGQAADKENALRAGFDHHLVKPIDMGELDKILAAASAASNASAVSAPTIKRTAFRLIADPRTPFATARRLQPPVRAASQD